MTAPGTWEHALHFVNGAPARAAETPSPETIRETARKLVAEGPYYLEGHHHFQPVWMQRIQDWVLERIRWFLELIENVAPAGTLMYYLLIIGLVAILCALLAHITYSMYRAMRPRPLAAPGTGLEDDRGPDHQSLAEDARGLAAQGQYGDATRVLFRAALTLLEKKRGGRLRRGLTNREYLRTFRSDWVVASLKPFVEVLDQKWYRDERFEAGDFEHCAQALRSLEQALEERGL